MDKVYAVVKIHYDEDGYMYESFEVEDEGVFLSKDSAQEAADRLNQAVYNTAKSVSKAKYDRNLALYQAERAKYDVLLAAGLADTNEPREPVPFEFERFGDWKPARWSGDNWFTTGSATVYP